MSVAYEARISGKRGQDSNITIEPYPGISIMAKPLDTTSMAIARAQAEKMLKNVEIGLISIEQAGFKTFVQTDLDDPDKRAGLLRALMIRMVGKNQIMSWSGIVDMDTDEPLEVTEENINHVLDTFPIGDVFFERITAPVAEVIAAKEE